MAVLGFPCHDTFMVRIRAAAAAFLVAGSAALLVPDSAYASGPITDNGGDCTFNYVYGSTGPNGFFCEYSWTGGTDPYNVAGVVTPASPKVHITSVQASGGNGLIEGTCVLGFAGTVSLSLTDAVGSTATISGDLICARPRP